MATRLPRDGGGGLVLPVLVHDHTRRDRAELSRDVRDVRGVRGVRGVRRVRGVRGC